MIEFLIVLFIIVVTIFIEWLLIGIIIAIANPFKTLLDVIIITSCLAIGLLFLVIAIALVSEPFLTLFCKLQDISLLLIA